MAVSTQETAFRRGLRNGAPFLLMAIPFAALFGVVAADAGLQLAQTIGFSLLVIAGAAQFAALRELEDGDVFGGVGAAFGGCSFVAKGLGGLSEFRSVLHVVDFGIREAG